jgi:hypothetical protein
MEFLEYVKRQRGKAGCHQCNKSAQHMCACQTAMYCSVSCQAQDWTNHALICGKGDKREGEEQEDKRALKKKDLPSFEKKYPKEVLDMLIPFMEGKDLVNFSESNQASMVAFRNHVAKQFLFDLDKVPAKVLLELSPWVARIKTAYFDEKNAVLKNWPAKHLIQELVIEKFSGKRSLSWIYEDLGIAEFNNLKKLVLPSFIIKEGFIRALPTNIETLKLDLELELPMFDLSHLTHLKNLRVIFSGDLRRINVSIFRPLDKLKLVGGNIQFTTFYPIRKLTLLSMTAYTNPLDGCKVLKMDKPEVYQALAAQLTQSEVEDLTLRNITNTRSFPPRLKRLEMDNCVRIECQLPDDMQFLSLSLCEGRINIPSQLEQLVLYNNQDLQLYGITTLAKCTSFTVDMNDSISIAINQMVRALRPSIVKTLVIKQQSHQDEEILIDNLSAFTALEDLTLALPGVMLRAGSWTLPMSLRNLRLNKINVEVTSIQRIPMLIENIYIGIKYEEKSFAAFMQQPILGNNARFPVIKTNKYEHEVQKTLTELPNLKTFFVYLDHAEFDGRKWTEVSDSEDAIDGSSSSSDSDDDE